MEHFAALIEASAIGTAARESDWLYPVANLFHLLGLVMLIGGIGILDLRIAGAFRALPLAALSLVLTPIAVAGIVLLVPSGAILFAADATALIHSSRFLLKLGLIGIALLNALAFRRMWRADREPTFRLKAMAIGSILLWLTIGSLGRLIAYA